MWLHRRNWDCRGWESTPFHPLCICSWVIPKGLITCMTELWEPWKETPDTQVTGPTSWEPWERIVFPGFLCVVSSGAGDPWQNSRRWVLQSCYWSILFYLHSLSGWSHLVLWLYIASVSHSHIHLQSSPLFQVPDSVFWTTPKWIMCKLNS